MNETQGNAVLEYSLDRLSESEFLTNYGMSKQEIPAEIEKQLSKALDDRNSDNVELALIIGFKYEFAESVLLILHQLLECTWHFKHEDIIGLLQEFSSPLSVKPLCNAVELKEHLDYLNYDNYGSYYKKCFWALNSVGNEESINTLMEFSNHQDSIISEQAKYSLSKLAIPKEKKTSFWGRLFK
jgi:HEAT repeat protein